MVRAILVCYLFGVVAVPPAVIAQSQSDKTAEGRLTYEEAVDYVFGRSPSFAWDFRVRVLPSFGQESEVSVGRAGSAQHVVRIVRVTKRIGLVLDEGGRPLLRKEIHNLDGLTTVEVHAPIADAQIRSLLKSFYNALGASAPYFAENSNIGREDGALRLFLDPTMYRIEIRDIPTNVKLSFDAPRVVRDGRSASTSTMPLIKWIAEFRGIAEKLVER